MDLEAILAGLAERDKWRARLTTLQGELQRVRTQRRKVDARLRRLARELKRLQATAEAMVNDHALAGRGGWGSGGAATTYRPVR